MRTMTRRIASNYKHKRCKTRTIRIKITMTRKVTNSYNKKRGKGR
jgi:hypothetical protein